MQAHQTQPRQRPVPGVLEPTTARPASQEKKKPKKHMRQWRPRIRATWAVRSPWFAVLPGSFTGSFTGSFGTYFSAGTRVLESGRKLPGKLPDENSGLLSGLEALFRCPLAGVRVVAGWAVLGFLHIPKNVGCLPLCGGTPSWCGCQTRHASKGALTPMATHDANMFQITSVGRAGGRQWDCTCPRQHPS